MFTNTIAKYKSIHEDTSILIEKDELDVLFWVFHKEKGKKRVLSFDNMYTDIDVAYQLIDWFENQEKKGVPITKALEHLETESQALEEAVLGKVKRSKV